MIKSFSELSGIFRRAIKRIAGRKSLRGTMMAVTIGGILAIMPHSNKKPAEAAGQRINLCQFSASTLPELTNSVREAFLGQKHIPQDIFHGYSSMRPPQRPPERGMNPKLQYSEISFHCDRPNSNVDRFGILVEWDADTISDAEVILYYEDSNFAARHEAIRSDRYTVTRGVHGVQAALESLLRDQKPTRDEFTVMMTEGNFARHKGCVIGDAEILYYFKPPYPINSVAHRMGANLNPTPPVAVSAAFSKSTGELLSPKATKEIRIECAIDQSLLKKQWSSLLKH